MPNVGGKKYPYTSEGIAQAEAAKSNNMSSSESLGRAFDQRLPSAMAAAQARQGPFGALSPRAAIMDVTSALIDLFRGGEGQRGSRMAGNAATKLVNKNR